MHPDEQEPRKKKKRDLQGKMGLDLGSSKHAPPMARPGIFPGSAEGELNERAEDDFLGDKVRNKLSTRRQHGR